MTNLFSDMHNLFSVSKTLRFELKPIGKTQEYFETNILSNDEIKAEAFKKVKKYCDEYHKSFIDRCLSNIDVDAFNNLLNQYIIYFEKNNLEDKEVEQFDKIKQALREFLSTAFTKNPDYKGLFGKEMIKIYLKDFYAENKEILKEIELFDDFTTYFVGYNTNRENMYLKDEKHTAIAYRLIDENLPTYIKNKKAFDVIIKNIPEIKTQIFETLGLNIENYLGNISNYSNTLTQKCIEEYNLIISGKSLEDGTKIQGINEKVNLFNQKNKTKLPKLKELYKQILSDTNSASFKLDLIQNDKDLIDLIKDYYINFENKILNNNDFIQTISAMENYNLAQIYANADTSLTAFSKGVYGDWAYINDLLSLDYDAHYTGKQPKGSEKYEENKNKYLKKIKEISIAKIEDLIEIYDSESANKICPYFKNESTRLIDEIKKSYNECEAILDKQYDETTNLIKDSVATEKIKILLDNLKEFQGLIKLLIPKNKTLETDSNFYNSLKYDMLNEITSVYNKIRNYMTKKPYSVEKIKLNFDCPTLLSGWDLNKEESNLSVLFIKDNLYYLGIMNKNDRKLFNPDNFAKDSSGYQKIEYKLLPGPNKMLPKVFFSSARIEYFNPSEYILSNYEKGLHKKGKDFDLEFCHELIDFFKTSLNRHEEWKNFAFKFSDTKSYDDISKFYREVEHQGYKISYSNFSESYINQLVEEGKLYLFQIYNKDFSEYSKGRPNLHTLYWKAIFDKDNLKNVVYKLNGGAEIFYRKKSIVEKVTHPKNEPIVNKNPNNIKKQSIFEYNLIKNKRYTVDKFQFHVPVTMNFKAIGENRLNTRVNEAIKLNDDIYIIGIDRGERHLLYISVINPKGEIVEQCSLNKIINEYNNVKYETDYHELLNRKEQEREKARKSWETIENIKELKEGYMSQVVHKLNELIIKYNAIIVLEDLNSGFKNSRKKVEKQVYDKFETKFISKLSYLINKEIEDKYQEGGLLNAYQLANPDIKSEKQNGIVFYIPAWCTSKIDPITGFVNLFDTKKIDVNFIENFDDIKFNQEEDYFEFIFDYSKFSDKSCGDRKHWTICSFGDRIRTFRNIHKNNEWDNETVNLTKEFKYLFEKYDIDFSNLKEEIREKTDKQFFSALKEKDGFYGFGTLFRLLVQLRNSVTGKTEDYILSPVKSKNGTFFDSRNCGNKLPQDADANGAYNIARKGLMLVQRIKELPDSKNKLDYGIKNADWLNFIQSQDK